MADKCRKMTPGEKLAREADRRNARVREDVPLFADQLELGTAEGLYWKRRRDWARAADTYTSALKTSERVNCNARSRLTRRAGLPKR